jgi:hypothetical protein
MRALLVSATLLGSLLLLMPAAVANHATCGDPDGYLLTPDLQVWLEPGCTGASYESYAASCLDHADETVAGVTVVVLVDGYPCTVAGVWLP